MKRGAAHDLETALTCRRPFWFTEVLSISPLRSSLHCIADKQPCRLTEGDTKELCLGDPRHMWLSPAQGMPLPTRYTPVHIIPSSEKRTDPLALPQPWEEANRSHSQRAGGSALVSTSLLPPVRGSRTQASPSHPGTAFTHRQPQDERKVSAGEGSIQCREQLTRVKSES